MSVLMPPSDTGPLFPHPYSHLPEPTLAPGVPQPPAPDEAACVALWEKYAMPPHIRRHCKVVAHIACTLAGRAAARGYRVDMAQVKAAGLLHDLAKAYSIQCGAGHAHLGASWVVAETRHHAVAQGVMLHVHWPWRIPVDDGARLCTLPFFILYADKRTRHDQCVTLDERFADLLERYGRTEAARAGIQASHQQGLTIERAFEAHLGCSLHEDSFDCGRLVL